MEGTIEVNGVHLTDEQLDAILKERSLKKKAEQAKKREEYEDLREEIVVSAVKGAIEIQGMLQRGKELIMNDLLSFRELMVENNDLPKNSLGGYSLKSKDDTMKVKLKIQNVGDFDERADMAESHIRDFFERRLKEKDPQVFEQFMELLERKKGKFEYSRVMKILQNEDRYDDESWKKGCALFKESFHITSSKAYPELYMRTGIGGEWELVNLNFASCPYDIDVKLKKEEKV